MVHRALLGSLERFFGVLVEHYGGSFPGLACPGTGPGPPGDGCAGSVRRVHREGAERAGIQRGIGLPPEKIGAKVRDGAMQKISVPPCRQESARPGLVPSPCEPAVWTWGRCRSTPSRRGLEEEVGLRANETRLTARG